MMLPVRYLNNDEIKELLSVEETIVVMEDLFKDLSDCQMPPKVYLDIPNGDFRAMPAVVKNTAGIKWCGVHLNEGRTKRKVNIFAKVIINDVATGKLLLLMDAEALTAIRTAAVTGLATKYISGGSSEVASFIGCGNQTKYQIEAILNVRDIKLIKLYDLDITQAEKMAEHFDNTVVCDSVKDCVEDADIITSLTPSRVPFLEYGWLKENSHINAVGADAEGKREMRPSILTGVGVVVYDEWEQCSHSGEIQYLDEVNSNAKLSSLEDIVSHKKIDLINGNGITMFDATGLAIEDVAAARCVYEKL